MHVFVRCAQYVLHFYRCIPHLGGWSISFKLKQIDLFVHVFLCLTPTPSSLISFLSLLFSTQEYRESMQAHLLSVCGEFVAITQFKECQVGRFVELTSLPISISHPPLSAENLHVFLALYEASGDSSSKCICLCNSPIYQVIEAEMYSFFFTCRFDKLRFIQYTHLSACRSIF